MNLQNLQILVTRPRPFGEMLCEKIRAAGGEAFYLPTVEIIPATDQITLQAQLQVLSEFDWVIFTSPQAVFHSIKTILEYEPAVAAQVKFAAVGAGTAKELYVAGITSVVIPMADWRTEGLLDLAEFSAVKDKKIAIIQGLGGRNSLSPGLAERGAKVTQIIAYQRILPKIDIKQYKHLFEPGRLDIMVFTSQACFENLLLLIAELQLQIMEIPILVISERIAEEAKQKGFKQIMVAKNASNEEVLVALFNYKRTLNGN